VRLSGLVAHHELVFASHGETLSLRHDSVSRSSFMPGLLMTVRQARKIEGLVTSLEEILVLAGLCLPGG
jgi:4-hydroxy-tetrahydrodipicolinate reductase